RRLDPRLGRRVQEEAGGDRGRALFLTRGRRDLFRWNLELLELRDDVLTGRCGLHRSVDGRDLSGWIDVEGPAARELPFGRRVGHLSGGGAGDEPARDEREREHA